ncbi:hypothetical protein T440DRAFT_514849 [Plenodomus tracheiphilus IPT5]|uniref:Uncharacterized protein n=1 Tax=Plenodomus tracheiphilus IPT5 TaxID=1408161 RepID=A0A6A7BI24_9PLEO|nr:hypothetical protein T440DRAFT_514849 [Plenodomus tracheiphilus IPT5]
MNHNIRPVSEATFVEPQESIHKRSSQPSAKSTKGVVDVNVEAITEDREVDQDNSNSSTAWYKKESGYCSEDVKQDVGIDWKPGFRHQFPWIGFAGFIVIIFATAMAVAILASSHEKRVKDWPPTKFATQPNVLLNIANQVQNLGLITLIGQGLAIAWWRKALQGSSLEELHKNHACSNSFYAIITSGNHFNIIALAALMTKFAVIDSTLFQKATRTEITQQKAYMNTFVTGWFETEWPLRAGGIIGDEGNIKTVDAAWASVLDAYSGKIANGKMHDSLEGNASFFGCPFRQECSGAIQGLGFAFNCSTSIEDVDYGLQRSTQWGGVFTSYPLWDISFNASWASETKPYVSVLLDMLYVDSHTGNSSISCPGTLTRRTCEVRPALVEYPITIMTPSKEELAGKNIVTYIKFFDDKRSWPINTPLDGTQQIDELKVLKYVDLSDRFNETSTVGALTYVLNNLYSSSANLTYTTDWDVAARGGSASTTFFADNDREDKSRCWYDIDNFGKDDPAVEMLRKLNTLSFVTSHHLKGAPTTDVSQRAAAGMSNQTIQTSVTGIVEEYITNFAYVGGALAATLITVLLVIPVYWGFWQLGRKITLGPLEISNAFGAPIIAPERTKAFHGDFDQVLEDVGKRSVQYGQLVGRPVGLMGWRSRRGGQAGEGGRGDGRETAVRRIGIGAVVGGGCGCGDWGASEDVRR